MPLFTKSVLKIRFNKNRWNRQKQKKAFFQLLESHIFNIFLNFKCDRKENNSKKKYNLYNTKRTSQS